MRKKSIPNVGALKGIVCIIVFALVNELRILKGFFTMQYHWPLAIHTYWALAYNQYSRLEVLSIIELLK